LSKVLEIESMLTPDNLGTEIAEKYITWDTFRQTKLTDWDETRRYIFATDTTQTSNSKLPWKNKTTIPKLCQIRDNLKANYVAALFPKRQWLFWEGENKASEESKKKRAIEQYMGWVVDHPQFKKEVAKMVEDYIDTGNAFATVEWVDERNEVQTTTGIKTQYGYVGPMPKRISPLDIVFNPTASAFLQSPKIIRSIMSLGEVFSYLQSITTDMNREHLEALKTYMLELRSNVRDGGADFTEKDAYLRVDGFTSFREYLQSNYCELLTFYGDLFDVWTGTLYKNHVITVVDRHKVLSCEPQPSYFGYPPIYHTGWRTRQDNLWAMGPLDNLVGMQYRIDHLENLKADVFDLITFPPLKIKGFVEDFEWGPMERIVMDADGDVEMMAPPFNVLTVDNEIAYLEEKMEIMAGAPKEAMGFRNPGEKTMYEIQRMENAYTRIFQQKIAQFEEQILEPLLNSMLELAWRKQQGPITIRVFNDEFEVAEFKNLTPEDITGAGRLKPLAARHFGEKAERLQNLQNTYATFGQDQAIMVHFSGLKIAQMLEEFMDIEDYGIVQPYIRIAEQADMQRQMDSAQMAVQTESMTPSGVTADDLS